MEGVMGLVAIMLAVIAVASGVRVFLEVSRVF